MYIFIALILIFGNKKTDTKNAVLAGYWAEDSAAEQYQEREVATDTVESQIEEESEETELANAA